MSTEPVKDELLRDLRAQKNLNSSLSALLFVVVSAVTVLAISALALDLAKNQNTRVAILASAGVGVPAMLVWMRSVIREWSQINLLITLVSHSDENGVQMLIEKLISKVIP